MSPMVVECCVITFVAQSSHVNGAEDKVAKQQQDEEGYIAIKDTY